MPYERVSLRVVAESRFRSVLSARKSSLQPNLPEAGRRIFVKPQSGEIGRTGICVFRILAAILVALIPGVLVVLSACVRVVHCEFPSPSRRKLTKQRSRTRRTCA